jgi:hypothetical protein
MHSLKGLTRAVEANGGRGCTDSARVRGNSEMKNNQRRYDPRGTDPFVPLISGSYVSARNRMTRNCVFARAGYNYGR